VSLPLDPGGQPPLSSLRNLRQTYATKVRRVSGMWTATLFDRMIDGPKDASFGTQL
jgi:hypothetical protein